MSRAQPGDRLEWLAIRAVCGEEDAAKLGKDKPGWDEALQIAAELRRGWETPGGVDWIRFKPPPVYSGNWNTCDWLRWICDFNWARAKSRLPKEDTA